IASPARRMSFSLARASEQLIRSKLETQPGQPFNPGAIARDIRRLYDMGYFSAIQAETSEEAGKYIVGFVVTEKRVIDSIKIAGNKKLRERALRGAISWQEGDSFVPEAYPEERDAILKLYQSKGFPNATVDIVAEDIGPGRVRLTYAISEGGKARIHAIVFSGNQAISDRQLRKLMKTKRAWWFLGGKYDEATFESDLKAVMDEYANRGRLEAAIPKTDFDYSANGKSVTINVFVSEGPEYRVDSIEVADNQVFDTDEITRLFELKTGDVHNKSQVAKDAELVSKGYEDSGYINASVAPQVTVDREKKATHIVYRIAENDLKYIKEIKVTGNSVTRDEIVRRTMMALPGERFDGGALRASQRALENTSYFEAVRLTMENVPDDDRFANLLVDVDEGKTGSFNFGAGYSTEDRFGGNIELDLKNFDITNWPTFSGGGQEFRIKLQLGQVRSQYSLSFTDREFLGLPLSFGFDVYDESYDQGDTFREDTRGAQVRLGKMLSPYVGTRVALRYNDVKISDLPSLGYPTLRRERGDGTTASLMWGINRNTIDVPRDPSSGSSHDFMIELTGLGGDYDYYRLAHDSTWHYAFGKEKNWIVTFRTRQGWVDEYGGSDFVPVSARYFAGGASTIRGYDSNKVGPKERRFVVFGKKRPIGGELLLLDNLELKYKINKTFRVYTFVDSGGVWREAGDFSFGDMKYSAGLGFGVDIPKMGPIRIDYGIPLNPDPDQGSGRLHLMTGFKF
ncbi:MAG TPA: outer membrane protein assembly factor BamA, partial [Candidatus Hydrogenedentes bacterium]|nr:outer membrane protein assembly factor BamA [Candidatus Hydrogenedentota bacterium]